MQIFQAELRERQPEIERITSLADEILTACHPNAVRFVRYYLTITQTRWQQAVHRSDQRAARMHDALRAARGTAALVDELVSWLSEAQALLMAKDRDTISDDLTVVQALLQEHLVYSSSRSSNSNRSGSCTSRPLYLQRHIGVNNLPRVVTW